MPEFEQVLIGQELMRPRNKFNSCVQHHQDMEGDINRALAGIGQGVNEMKSLGMRFASEATGQGKNSGGSHRHNISCMYGAIKDDYVNLRGENQYLAGKCNELVEVIREYQQYQINIQWRIQQARENVDRLKMEQYQNQQLRQEVAEVSEKKLFGAKTQLREQIGFTRYQTEGEFDRKLRESRNQSSERVVLGGMGSMGGSANANFVAQYEAAKIKEDIILPRTGSGLGFSSTGLGLGGGGGFGFGLDKSPYRSGTVSGYAANDFGVRREENRLVQDIEKALSHSRGKSPL